MVGAIGIPAANAGAMGRSAVGAKITQNVFGRRDRQPGGECRFLRFKWMTALLPVVVASLSAA